MLIFHQKHQWPCQSLADARVTVPKPSASSAALSKAGQSQSQTQHHVSVRNFQQDEVLVEQLTRNIQFFGLEAQQKIADAFVVVVGLGGVGSHCAHLLLRSGVGKLRLIDFDQVQG